jgi:hypothetical protein
MRVVIPGFGGSVTIDRRRRSGGRWAKLPVIWGALRWRIGVIRKLARATMWKSMNRSRTAWLLLVSALGLHVVEEATTGFLPFYNDIVFSLRERLGFFPAPTFSFGLWLGGLISGVALLFLLTPSVIRGGPVLRWVCVAFGVLMVFNGLGHLLASVYFGTLVPGVWSSPFLMITATYLVYRVLVTRPEAGS